MASKPHHPAPPGQMIPVRIKGNPKCATHRDNDVVLVCQKCEELICVSCSISTHKSHIDTFVELPKIVRNKKPILQDFINETENQRLPRLNGEINLARKHLNENPKNFKGLSSNMKQHFEKCRQELERLILEFDSRCYQLEQLHKDLLQGRVTQLEERHDSLFKLSAECKATLQSGTAVLVYDCASDILNYDDKPHPPNIDMPQFTPRGDITKQMKDVLGFLDIRTDHQPLDVPTDHQPQSPTADQRPAVRPKLTRDRDQTSSQPSSYKLRDRPRVITKFSWEDHITSIRPIADGHAWLCDYKINTALLVNAKGETIQRIKHGSNITDISVDPNTGHLWLCCWDTQTVHEASSSAVSPVVTRFTTEHNPYSLCVTREGRVVVGMYVKDRPYQVGVYTKKGVVLHTTTGEGTGEETGRVVPFSITQCPITSNIALVSGEVIRGDGDVDDWRRHIVVYTDRFSLLYQYRGTDIKGRQVRTPGRFDPRSITYDSRGNIVMADYTRNTIELISGEEHHIKTLHSGNGQGPIGLQTGDVLWSEMVSGSGDKELNLLQYYTD